MELSEFRHKADESKRIVSAMLAELFELDKIDPELIVVTPEEFQEMKRERGQSVYSIASLTDEGIVVSYKEDMDEFNEALVSELAHLYHRKSGGDNAPTTLPFDHSWIHYTQLKKNGVPTLILPRGMTEEFSIPIAKREVVDIYCSLYFLGRLGRGEEAAKLFESSRKEKKGLVGKVINVIENDIKQGFRGNYYLYKRFLQGLRRGTNSYAIIIKQYFALCVCLGYWLAEGYKRELIGNDLHSFRTYVRRPIVPISAADLIIFDKELPELNQYLLQNKMPALGRAK